MAKVFRSAALALGLLAIPFPAQAALVLDQQATAQPKPGFVLRGSSVFYQPSFAVGRLGQMQSVTAGTSGLLSKVDFQMFRSAGFPDLAFSISIVDGEPGLTGPINRVGTRNFTKGELPTLDEIANGGFFSVDVSAFGYEVTPGQKFSLLLELPPKETSPTSPTISGPFWIYGIEPDDLSFYPPGFITYAGGFNTVIESDGVRQITGADRGFRTFVETSAIPEPSSWALMIAGFGLAGATLRQRRAACIRE